MGELTVRPYTSDDAGAFTDLINAVVADAGGHPGWTADFLHGLIDAMVRDHAADTVLYLDGRRVVAGGIVSTPPDNGYRLDISGGVRPEYRGRGLGRDVLGWQLARAGQIHAAAGGPAGWVAEANAVVTDATALRLFARFGMAPVRYFFDMVAPTGTAASAPMPAGLRSSAYQPAMARALYEAHREAFRDHWGYQMRGFDVFLRVTAESESFRPDLSRIAYDGDEIVAYVLSYTDADPARLYIGQVGTRRPWRRRGLAGALLAEVLAAAGGAGLREASLGVDADSPTGAVGLYERAGFEVEARSVDYHRALGAVPVQSAASTAQTSLS